MKKIFILGGTGSIGENVLSVIDSNKDKFELIGISAKDNINKVQEIIHKYNPKYIYLDNATARKNIQQSPNKEALMAWKVSPYRSTFGGPWANRDETHMRCLSRHGRHP